MTHPSLCALVGVMALLLPWQHHSYKTLNILRNVCYFDDIKLEKHFHGNIKACEILLF